MTNEIIITKEVSPIVKKAELLNIKDAKSMADASEMLSTLNQKNDAITDEKEKVTKPLNEALNAERGRWKPVETIIKQAITIIRDKMSEYQTEQFNLAKQKEDDIAARVGSGKGKLKDETASKKIDEIQRAPEKVATDAGMTKFTPVKTLDITDETKIPRKYLVINEKLLLDDLKAGKKVAGAQIKIVQRPVNFR